MLKSTCVPGQKHIEDFKRHPKIYWDFEDLIKQYKDKYGQYTPFYKIYLYDYTFQMRGNSRLKRMNRAGFFATYAWYVKIKEVE